MQAKEIKKSLIEQTAKAMIISYADSNHYLAGCKDEKGNFHCLNQANGKSVTFNSILEAEKMLEKLGAKSALVQLDTAYDEMVGSDENRPCCYELKFIKN